MFWKKTQLPGAVNKTKGNNFDILWPWRGTNWNSLTCCQKQGCQTNCVPFLFVKAKPRSLLICLSLKGRSPLRGAGTPLSSGAKRFLTRKAHFSTLSQHQPQYVRKKSVFNTPFIIFPFLFFFLILSPLIFFYGYIHINFSNSEKVFYTRQQCATSSYSITCNTIHIFVKECLSHSC